VKITVSGNLLSINHSTLNSILSTAFFRFKRPRHLLAQRGHHPKD
jgi:hypothetical protein